MAFKKGEKRPEGAGRKKGSANKTTVKVREAMELAFEGIGGVPALVEWAQKNQTEFYKLFAKLLPVQVEASVDGKLEIDHKVSPAVAAMLDNLREVTR